MSVDASAPALEVADLELVYRVRGVDRPVLRGLSLAIGRGQSYGLVGESGCGKSTAALGIVRYLPRNGRITGGSISVAGRDVLALGRRGLRDYHARTVSMVYQNPGSALNPSLRVGTQIVEAFTVLGVPGKEATERARETLVTVQIADPSSVMSRYPHQLSGGMQQRVVIAMALAKNPELLILDEPTTGLDATVEAEVLDLVSQLQAGLHTSVLFISHNLGVISKMCSRVGVLYAGRLVEEGPVETVLQDPRHPYTVGLLRCIPRGGVRKDHGRLDTIPGFLPPLGIELPGCVFADRCALADERCHAEEPPFFAVSSGHESRCWYHDRARDLPREEAADLELPPVDRTQPPLVELDGLTKVFTQRGHDVHALTDVTAAIWPGETLGLVGESGSGKTTLARTLLGIVPATAGTAIARGHRAAAAVPEALAEGAARAPDRLPESRLGAQPQTLGPTNPPALAPEARGRHRPRRRGSHARSHFPRALDGADADTEVGSAVRRSQAARRDRTGVCRGSEARRLRRADIRARRLRPGGDPEPPRRAPGREARRLHLHLTRSRRRPLHLGPHRRALPRAAAGARAADVVFGGPHHPYTEALLSAVPTIDGGGRDRIRLEGDIPSAAEPPSGCVFHTRCPRFLGQICVEQEPPLVEVEDGHLMRCHIPIEELRQLQQPQAASAAGGKLP